MSNLSPKQFNKAVVTRTLTAAGVQRSKPNKVRGTRFKLPGSGFNYHPIDENTTAIRYSDLGATDPERRAGEHEKIFNSLKAAGYDVEMHPNEVRVKH